MSNSLDVLPHQRRKPLRISTDLPLARRSSDSSSSSCSPTNQNTTPGTTPSTGIPQCFFHVICMHDFESSDPDHLPFYKDEVLTVVKQEQSGWWAAIRPKGDRIGWIPSLFVLPLDRRSIIEHPDETLPLWPYENYSDPLSAVHDPWVPVSEDCTVLSFRLVTPTDLVLYKGFFDDRARHHNREPFILPNDERSPNVEDVCIPPTSPTPPYRIQQPQSPSPIQSESEAPHLTRSASPRLLDVALHHHPHHRMDGQTSLPCLRVHDTQLISTLDFEDSLIVLKSTDVSQEGTDSDDEIDAQSQHVTLLPTDFLAAGPNQDISDIELLGLIIWGPDNLAKQLCVLMHTLYATIRQAHCLDWTRGRRSTEVTGLRHFFDIHNDIASWVRNSIHLDNDMTRQTETLNFWIKVAERCHLHRNFDSLCAIILALSVSRSSSSFGSAWRRCAHKRTFATLHNMLDVKNKFSCFMGIMDAAKGPSVPFVRRYLEHIKELHPERFNNSPHQSRHADGEESLAAPCKMQLARISTLLRHQSSQYDFKIAKSIRSFIDHELQTVRLANGWPLARS